jgi:hypothetical protein
MRIRTAAMLVLCLAFSLVSSLARAQARGNYAVRGDRATGENYHVELGGYFWNPTPDMSITSESLGIPGDRIDFVEDLGVEKARFKQMKLVLRPSTKHKFRYEYTPITYNAVGRLRAAVRFNGIRYPVEFPVTTDFHWKAHRFAYEYDVVYRDRGFFGILLEAKYTDVQTTLSNILDTEFVSAKAPIPSIGGIGRVYVAPNISITAELSGFPEGIISKIDEDSEGHYFDFDLYGTVNFTDHAGAQAGYRSFNVFYNIDNENTGRFSLKGLYFGGVVRF